MRALPLRPVFAWLEITGFCNLACRHCYANSSPQGTHGVMSAADWLRVIDELAAMGVRDVQFIGGEPTLHPELPRFVRHALGKAMRVEVFSNLTHIRPEVWDVLRLPGVRVAFSYYSDRDADHDDVTEARGAHARTRANVEKARELGVALRGSVIDVLRGQRAGDAERDLLQLGIRDVRTDRVRPFGRGADGAYPDLRRLCGMCGRAKFAVSPDGDMWPCVFARWMNLGNVREQSLQAVYDGIAMRAARAELEAAFPGSAVRMSPTACPSATRHSTRAARRPSARRTRPANRPARARACRRADPCATTTRVSRARGADGPGVGALAWPHARRLPCAVSGAA